MADRKSSARRLLNYREEPNIRVMLEQHAEAQGRSVSEELRAATRVQALGIALTGVLQPHVRAQLGDLAHEAMIRQLRAELATAAAEALPDLVPALGHIDPERPGMGPS